MDGTLKGQSRPIRVPIVYLYVYVVFEFICRHTRDAQCILRIITRDAQCILRIITRDAQCILRIITRDAQCILRIITRDAQCILRIIIRDISTDRRLRG